MRAEANSEAEAAEEAPEVEVEGVVESDAQPEEVKPPRKPRVKLGDVMGVIVLSILATGSVVLLLVLLNSVLFRSSLQFSLV